MLVAEVIRHFCPTIVELHNYSPANSSSQKQYNWATLSARPLRRIGVSLSQADIEAVIQCKPNAVEKVLRMLMIKIPKYMNRQESKAGQEPLSSQQPLWMRGAKQSPAPV